ncbi:rhamnogalacturonate lyase-like [Belonocnema kinseyi]|uniref:rhamnogalacturonate lyase-like n=1 Tax=Belonocnema kinseyi TaxID=2817044 RepID=UPI00143D8AC0|nr:rhamnogalacturonate lyase-like [Belonocnema kinseyi]
MNKLKKIIRQQQREHRNKNWITKLTRLQTKDNSLWKMTEALKGSIKTTVPILHGPQGLVFSEKDKADVLALQYEQFHRLTTDMINAAVPGVYVEVKGLTAFMNNGIIKIFFDKDATVSALYKNGKNLVANVGDDKTFYIDWNNSKTYHFFPSTLTIIRKSVDHAHIMYVQDDSQFAKIEYHIIMEKGLSGIYSYIRVQNNKRYPISFGLMRIVYRFDPKLMYQITNGVQEGMPPPEFELRKKNEVQDTTWKLKDGNIYSKYDYAGYIRNTYYQGVFGHGYGVWLISASREYHSGGPLKQDLLVHHESLILNCLTAAHFGTPSLVAPPGWSKLYGPWLLYFNTGTDSEVKYNAIYQYKREKKKWPYQWMNESDYPLKRGTLSGRITGPPQSMVVLSSSLRENFDMQTLGYSYSKQTRKDGTFKIGKIRPGMYKLTAYPVAGFGIGYQSEKIIKITAGMNEAFLNLPVPTTVLWSIGETNRRSDSYRYSNEKRNYKWHLLPPANLNFQIGKSNPANDWYYAQTYKGTWNIIYQDIPNKVNRTLRIGIAAASTSQSGLPILAVSMNECLITKFRYQNDHSIYRGAQQSGNFHYANVIIPAKMIKKGRNIVNLSLHSGSVMYDSINLS